MHRYTHFVIVFVLVAVACGNDDFKRLDAIRHERPCLATGGICTIAVDCPTGQLTKKKGLCPDQQKMGVECCYGLSVKETRCGKRGGDCFPGKNACSEALEFKKATDCPKDTTCCILV